MALKRWVVPAGLLIFAGIAGVTQIAGRRQTEEEAFMQEFPDALIYKGAALFQLGDYRAAGEVWEQYLKVEPQAADTVSIRALIGEAKRAAAGKRPRKPRS